MYRKNFPERQKARRIEALQRLERGTKNPSKKMARTQEQKDQEIQNLKARIL